MSTLRNFKSHMVHIVFDGFATASLRPCKSEDLEIRTALDKLIHVQLLPIYQAGTIVERQFIPLFVERRMQGCFCSAMNLYRALLITPETFLNFN